MGQTEIIDDQKNGYLIANRDMEQMSNVIVKLIKDEGLRKELGQRGRKNSSQSFQIPTLKTLFP